MYKFGEDGLGGLLFGKVGVEVIEVDVVWIHEVNSGCVVDFVAALLRSFFIVNFVGLYSKLFHALLQLDIVPRNASHSNDVLAELRQVLLHDLRSVAFRVDRDKD